MNEQERKPTAMTDNKIPLIFLPGLLCDEVLWSQQVEALVDIADCRIADLTRDDSLSGMASRVLAWAPEHFALAGLSMGGYVAFEIMRQAPQRVSRLALFDTSATLDDAARAAQRQTGAASLSLGRFVGVGGRLLPRLIHASRVSGEVGQTVQAMATRVGSEAFLRQQQAILGRPDSRNVLATITVPTLVAVGDADVMTPLAESRLIHEGIPGSAFHVFRECGHLPALELPAQTSALLREWLAMPAR